MQAVKPDYAGGSIVNLMATLQGALGGPAHPYPPLREFPSGLLEGARHLLLLVIDGLGWHTLREVAPQSTLAAHLLGPLTSVFPSTTAAAIPVFLTGLAPQQHALTGWHMYCEEVDDTLVVLPLERRGGGALPPDFDPRGLFPAPPIYPRLPVECSVVTPAYILNSTFNRLHSEGAAGLGYYSLSQLVDRVLGRLAAPAARQFVYAYYPGLDSCAHEHGIGSRKVARLLGEIDREFTRLLGALAGSDTLVLVTADHGFIDARRSGHVELSRHPRLAGLLARPLCGERRLAFCYLKPGCGPAFEAYVANELADHAQARPSEALVAEGWFGLGAPAAALASRVGDYTLMMKQHCTIKDWVRGERRHTLIGVHGGVSPQEMTVPLVAVRC